VTPVTARRLRWIWVCLALLASCRNSALQQCTDLLAAKRYAAAEKRCAQVYAAERDPHAAAALVYSEYALGHGDEVLAWVARLAKAGKVRPGVWGLAAAVHEQRGEIDAAYREYRVDLALQQAAKDHRGAAYTLDRLFDLSWRRSRYREAFLFAGRALGEASRANDRVLEERSAEALYTVLYAIGDLEGARQALEMASSLGGGEDREGRAFLLANRGNLLADEGRLALARRDLEQALAMAAGSSNPQLFRTVHLNLTNIYLTLGDAGRAAHHVEEAWKYREPGEPQPVSLAYYRARVALAQKRPAEAARALSAALSQDPAPDWAWDLEYQRGRAAEAGGDLHAAEAAYTRSIGIIEEMRRSLAFDELKSWLLDRKREPFEALFRLQARSGRVEEALATAERAQARTFVDAYLQAVSSAPSPAGEPWSPELAAARLENLERVLPVMSTSPVAALQPIRRVLSAFGDRHGLVYFEAGDELWLIRVSGGSVRLRPLAAPAAEIRRLGERLLAHPEDSALAGQLGGILLPSGSLPRKPSTVHIVADGVLGNLPFAALRCGGRYLVEDHAVVLVPSLSALAALESRQGTPSGPPLILADPLANLPAAAAEGREVARLLAGSLRSRGEATSGALLNASGARILHLATHTGASSRGPWIQLADRRVRTAEIVMRRVGPPLVVLASCASGVRPGRQMWGSPGAAFLAAGSRAVLASLWSVGDEQARRLVLRFYAEGGAKDPAGALARAQRVAIRQGQSPIVWAPFVLFGSERFLEGAPQGG